jgi:hypothetical protein
MTIKYGLSKCGADTLVREKLRSANDVRGKETAR